MAELTWVEKEEMILQSELSPNTLIGHDQLESILSKIPIVLLMEDLKVVRKSSHKLYGCLVN